MSFTDVVLQFHTFSRNEKEEVVNKKDRKTEKKEKKGPPPPEHKLDQAYIKERKNNGNAFETF